MHSPKIKTLAMSFMLAFSITVGLGLVACSAASIISYINSGLQIALEFLPLAVPGLPPAVTSYFQSGLVCVQMAADEMATTDPNIVKSTKIGAACAGLVQANMPPGTPQRIVDLASKLATRISDILAHLPKTTPIPATATPAPGTLSVPTHAAAPKSKSESVAPMKASDIQKLHNISDRAKAAHAQLEQIKGK